MDAPGDLFMNETPTYYVSDAIVTDDLRRKLNGKEINTLLERIQKELERGDSFCDTKPHYDWEKARTRVNRVLREYGSSLLAP